MTDFFIGCLFVAMILTPAIIASKQWSNYETESLPENGGVSGIPGDET